MAAGDDLAAAAFAGDDGACGGEHEVAVGVVAVAVGVDEGADRVGRHLADGGVEGAGAFFRAGGIDDGGGAAAEDGAGVVEEPAAIHLDVGVDAGRDFLDAGRGNLSVSGDGLARHAARSGLVVRGV